MSHCTKITIPYAFFTCPCGYEFIIESNDANRIQRQRNMKMRLHKKNCSASVDSQEIVQNNNKKQTKKFHNNTQKLIKQSCKQYGTPPSAEQLQYNFLNMINEY
jgi:hypothetical protein